MAIVIKHMLVPSIVLSVYIDCLIKSSKQPYEVAIILCQILQMGKPRPRTG